MRLVRYTQPAFRSLSPVLPAAFRSPWAGLESELDRLFESALGDFATPVADRFPVDLYEDKDNTYLRAELPGVNREDIAVELVDGALNVTATRKTGEGENAETFTFSRTVSVPDSSVQADRISAAYENGVLTVTLPKREESKPRKITVAVK
jgi:HSP20 family protein